MGKDVEFSWNGNRISSRMDIIYKREGNEEGDGGKK